MGWVEQNTRMYGIHNLLHTINKLQMLLRKEKKREKRNKQTKRDKTRQK